MLHGAGTEEARARGKRLAGEAACAGLRDGMVLGLGTGSTVEWSVRKLGELCRGGLRVSGVATSARTERLAREAGVPLTSLDEHPLLDLAIDGADEVDPELDLIKGGGGAHAREKVVASAARRFVVVVDESKLVDRLGAAFALPVEVLPLATEPVKRRLAALGAEVALRTDRGAAYATDNGNRILDARWRGGIRDKHGLARELDATPGVVEHGLFLGMAHEVLVGRADGSVQRRSR